MAKTDTKAHYRNRRPCPTPLKLKFGLESQARKHADEIEERDGVRQEVYLCACGYFHRTSGNKTVRRQG